jgi:hypothetical protein
MEELFRLAQVVLEARNMQNHEQHTVAAAELKEAHGQRVLLEAKERECATELQAYKSELARAREKEQAMARAACRRELAACKSKLEAKETKLGDSAQELVKRLISLVSSLHSQIAHLQTPAGALSIKARRHRRAVDKTELIKDDAGTRDRECELKIAQLVKQLDDLCLQREMESQDLEQQGTGIPSGATIDSYDADVGVRANLSHERTAEEVQDGDQGEEGAGEGISHCPTGFSTDYFARRPRHGREQFLQGEGEAEDLPGSDFGYSVDGERNERGGQMEVEVWREAGRLEALRLIESAELEARKLLEAHPKRSNNEAQQQGSHNLHKGIVPSTPFESGDLDSFRHFSPEREPTAEPYLSIEEAEKRMNWVEMENRASENVLKSLGEAEASRMTSPLSSARHTPRSHVHTPRSLERESPKSQLSSPRSSSLWDHVRYLRDGGKAAQMSFPITLRQPEQQDQVRRDDVSDRSSESAGGDSGRICDVSGAESFGEDSEDPTQDQCSELVKFDFWLCRRVEGGKCTGLSTEGNALGKVDRAGGRRNLPTLPRQRTIPLLDEEDAGAAKEENEETEEQVAEDRF